MMCSRPDLSRTKHGRHSAHLPACVIVVLVVSSGSALAQDRTARETVVTDAAVTPIPPVGDSVVSLRRVLRGLGAGRPEVGSIGGSLAGFHHDAARARQAPAAGSPQGRWSGRHPVLLGTLIGAGGGMLWEAAACRGPSCKVGVAGLLGAGAGAYSGLVVSAIHTARLKQPVGTKTKIGIAAGAIGGAVGAFLACYGAGGCGGVS
jgi:hypothetical protein